MPKAIPLDASDIVAALNKALGNRAIAAGLLGISAATLRRRLERDPGLLDAEFYDANPIIHEADKIERAFHDGRITKRRQPPAGSYINFYRFSAVEPMTADELAEFQRQKPKKIKVLE